MTTATWSLIVKHNRRRAAPDPDLEAMAPALPRLLSRAAELLNLQQLAFDHLLGEADEQVEDFEVALFKGDMEGLHVEPVAGEDAFFVAPCGVGRGTAAAGVRAVDDVIVNERSGMNQFNNRAEADHAGAGVAQAAGCKQQQRGANALAAAHAQIFGNLRDRAYAGNRVAPQLPFNGREVIAEQIEDFPCRRYRQCTQGLGVPALSSCPPFCG